MLAMILEGIVTYNMQGKQIRIFFEGNKYQVALNMVLYNDKATALCFLKWLPYHEMSL